MADLEVIASGIMPIDSDFIDIGYEKDDGSENIYLLQTTEANAWELSFENATQAEFDVIYGLWQVHKTGESFTWLNSVDGLTYTVRFDAKPKFKPLPMKLYNMDIEIRKQA